MKPILIAAFVGVLLPCVLPAQKTKSFKVNPGEKVIEVIPRNEVYAFPEFINGAVYFRNNTYYPARLNYNALYSEMQFVDSTKKDTLSLANEQTIRQVILERDTFFFNEGYIRQIASIGGLRLGEKNYFVFGNRQKQNGFGTSGGEIETYSAIATRSYLSELVVMEVVTLLKKRDLYIGDRFGNFKKLNKKNFLEMYGKNQREVEDYMKKNKVNVLKEEDLIETMSHFTAEL